MTIERIITATIVTDTALHIGTGRGGEPTDAPLRRTAGGRLFIPGRATGGSLRTLATRLAPRLGHPPCRALWSPEEQKRQQEETCTCPVCQLFGALNPSEEDDKKTGGTASKLWISDASLVDARPPTHVRDGVGLRRDRGVAARNVKFDYEVIPRHTRFSLRWRLVDDDSDEARGRAQILAAALAEWEAGRGQLGGNVARGLGHFHLEELTYSKTAVNTPDDLIAYLRADLPDALAQDDADWWQSRLAEARQAARGAQTTLSIPAARSFIRVAFTLQLAEAFLINDPLVAALSGFDHAPLLEIAVSDERRGGLPLLSGASLRGVLRTRAERIARTLATRHWSDRDSFLAHCPACDPMAAGSSRALGNCDKRLEIPDEEEVLEEALCLACRLFGSPRRGSRLLVADAHWQSEALDETASKAQDFLAIDRFTGGGQEQAKFDAAPLMGAKFRGQLTLFNPRDWELGWLSLLLRDLAEGDLTIGFGAAKGYGQVQATDFKWTAGFIQEADFPAPASLLSGAQSSGVYQVKEEKGDWYPDDWGEQVQHWVNAFTSAVRTFAPDEATGWQPFIEDTFFTGDGRLLELYGLPGVEGSDHE